MGKFREIIRAVAALSFIALVCGTAAAGTLTVDANGGADFTSIQEAVDFAKEKDTILVMPGKYVENVNIGKPLTVISRTGVSEETVVEAADKRDHVFHISADNVNVSGFTFRGAEYEDNLIAGVYLDNVQNCIVQGNILSDNYYGIYLKKSRKNVLRENIASDNKYGLILCVSSGENVLRKNRVSDNYYGVYLENACNNNTLTGNTIFSNRENGVMVASSSCTYINDNDISANRKAGIKLDSSRGNCLSNNSVSDCERGIFIVISGDNRVTGNSVKSNSVCGLQLGGSAERNIIEENIFYGNKDGIFVAYSARYNTLVGNTVLNNSKGIYLLGHSDYNEIMENNVCSNSFGFYVENCKENVLGSNVVTDNTECGILLTGSFDNSIYNNYFNNTENAVEDKPNIWNGTKTAGTNIAGGSYLGGNCWATPDGGGFSRICEDTDGDGICDSPYLISDSDSDELALIYSPVVDSIYQKKVITPKTVENVSKSREASLEEEDVEKSPLGFAYTAGILLIVFLTSGRIRKK